MASYDDIINGTFNSLNPGVAGMYAGIYPSATSSPTRSIASQPGISPSQLAAMQAVPDNSYQWPNSSPVNIPGTPNGYSYADTGSKGRATPAMQQLIALAGSGTRPPWAPQAGASAPEWGAFEQAYSDAGNKPGTWMAQSRMQAQALMRQMAQRQAAGGAASVPHRGPSLLDLIGGGGVGRGSLATGGLMGLLQGGPMATRVPGPTPAQAAARAANFGGGREVINSNGNYVTSNGEWHYSDPAHSGFTPISNNQSLS